jgi:hypothetical protein
VLHFFNYKGSSLTFGAVGTIKYYVFFGYGGDIVFDGDVGTINSGAFGYCGGDITFNGAVGNIDSDAFNGYGGGVITVPSKKIADKIRAATGYAGVINYPPLPPLQMQKIEVLAGKLRVAPRR